MAFFREDGANVFRPPEDVTQETEQETPEPKVIPTGYFERRKRERAIRKEMRGIVESSKQKKARLSYNVWHRGEMCCHPDGTPIVIVDSGRAVLIRLRKVTFDPTLSAARWDKDADAGRGAHVASGEASEKMEEQNRERFAEAVRLAKNLSYKGAESLALVQVDASDNLILVGGSQPMARFLTKIKAMGWLESLEELKKHRVPVIATGSSNGEATERANRLLRSERLPKVMKDDRRRAAVTMDEDELAQLCKCVRCGRNVKEHDDSACVAPIFVPDSAAIAADDKAKARDHSRSQGQRRNVRETTRNAAQGLDTSETLQPVAGPLKTLPDGTMAAPGVNDKQKHPSDYCIKCGKHVLTHDDKACPHPHYDKKGTS